MAVGQFRWSGYTISSLALRTSYFLPTQIHLRAELMVSDPASIFPIKAGAFSERIGNSSPLDSIVVDF